jgi:PBP1b-binding outer membrane lipoprotein LpoB
MVKNKILINLIDVINKNKRRFWNLIKKKTRKITRKIKKTTNSKFNLDIISTPADTNSKIIRENVDLINLECQ